MNKNLVKRSFFQVVTTSGTATKDVMVEADEVYLTQVAPSAVGMTVVRQRERDCAAFLAANPGMSGIGTQTVGLMDVTYGRVNLDNPLTTDGKLMNRPVTTAAAEILHPERNVHLLVGIKETLTFKSVTSGTATVIIECVNYVPADIIGF